MFPQFDQQKVPVLRVKLYTVYSKEKKGIDTLYSVAASDIREALDKISQVVDEKHIFRIQESAGDLVIV